MRQTDIASERCVGNTELIQQERGYRMQRFKVFISGRAGKFMISVGILLISLFIMQLLAGTGKDSNKKAVEKVARRVEVMTASYGEYQLEVSANGSIESVSDLSITSAVRGQLLYGKNGLKSGTFFREGELLLEIDARAAENSVFLARANLINAIVALIPDFSSDSEKGSYAKWSSYLASLEIDADTPPLPEVTEQREKVKVSLRNIYAMYYTLKNAELTLSHHRVYAPFDGYISGNGLQVGSFVNAGQILVQLHDAVNLEIAVPLPISDFNLLSIGEGNPAYILSPGDETHRIRGHIKRFNTHLNEHSQSVSVHIGFQNEALDPAFFAGNYVRVQIPAKRISGVCRLPRYLLDQNSQILVAEEGRLQTFPVRIAATQDDHIFTDTDIPEDLKIITTFIQNPVPGMEIVYEGLLTAADSLGGSGDS